VQILVSAAAVAVKARRLMNASFMVFGSSSFCNLFDGLCYCELSICFLSVVFYGFGVNMSTNYQEK
jgi:hypothetical protein